ncbi:MAG: hypothetical protein II072_08105 [Clostridia bacterium]|nr:hypothetical protein [Clostridia bacterium]MBQ5488913.1 hypothetical protein [Clostridia bacterium]
MEEVNYIELLKQALVKIGAPPRHCGIGRYAEEALCIMEENGKWIVFRGERGRRYELMEFGTEKEACIYFLHKMKLML